jgi:hypothetical protein
MDTHGCSCERTRRPDTSSACTTGSVCMAPATARPMASSAATTKGVLVRAHVCMCVRECERDLARTIGRYTLAWAVRTCSKHVPWRNLCGCRLAAWLVERQHHSSFVAAFSQGASGDVSPNVIRRARGSTAEFELSGEGATPRESVLIAAQRQACRHAPSRSCCIVARHVTCCLLQRESMPVRRSAAAHFLPAWLRAELCVVASAVATPAGEGALHRCARSGS